MEKEKRISAMAKEDKKMQKHIKPIVKQINDAKTDRDKMVNLSLAVENIINDIQLPATMVVGVLSGIVQHVHNTTRASADTEALEKLLDVFGGQCVKAKKS